MSEPVNESDAPDHARCPNVKWYGDDPGRTYVHTYKVRDDVWVRGTAPEQLELKIQVNGIKLYTLRCLNCRRGTGAIPHRMIKAWKLLDEDAVRRPNWRDRPEHTQTCEVGGCGRVDVERHHWAPRSVSFQTGDEYGAENEMWPQSYLCRGHHRLWHLRMTGYRWRSEESWEGENARYGECE